MNSLLASSRCQYSPSVIKGTITQDGQEQYCETGKEKRLQPVQVLVNQRDRIAKALSEINQALQSGFSKAHSILSNIIMNR